MGILSDVGLVVKNSLLDKIQDLNLIKEADSKKEKDDCTLFVWNDIKWYMEDDIENLYDVLKNFEPEDYLLMESCPEYPDNNCVNNRGEFFDNPFELTVVVTCCLQFED